MLATRLALLEATEDFEGAKRLAQSSLQAADAQSSRGKPAKGQDAAAKALLYQSLARVQLKVPEALPNDAALVALSLALQPCKIDGVKHIATDSMQGNIAAL